jgi:hypothetical protein
MYKPAAGAWMSAPNIGRSPASLTTSGTTIYLAYLLTNEVLIASRSSPTAAVDVDNDVNIPRSTEFSLAVDANGGQHLSYLNDSAPQLGYAYRPAAGSWTLTTIDTPEQIGGTDELVVDAAGGVHVGYTAKTYFGADFDLRYAYKPANGSWSITPITVAKQVGSESAFALGPSGAPHLTYFKHAAHDLVHVYRCE